MRNPDARRPDEYEGEGNAANGLDREHHQVIIGMRAGLSKLGVSSRSVRWRRFSPAPRNVFAPVRVLRQTAPPPLKMRRFQQLPWLALLWLATINATAAAAAKPNLIVIMADDLGASELGAYGHPSHRTPNLDRLAKTGVQFDTCFTAPVCHPTRFTLMTGQYGFRTGVLNFSGKRAGPPVKHEGADNIANHLTFAQPLQAAGYATAVAGKWQLSGSYPEVVRETGFDEYCIWGYREHYSEDDRRKATSAGIDFRSRYWR